jgi:cyclopropane-fatty-acyl-phospholipid synthase
MNTSRQPTFAYPGGLNPLSMQPRSHGRPGNPSPLDRLALSAFRNAVGRPPIELSLWDCKDGAPIDSAAPRITFLTRRALWQSCLRPDLGLPDAYAAGEIRVDGDLIEVLTTAFRATDQSPWQEFRRRYLHWVPLPQGNSPTESRRNISVHYDLGNAFYQLWLDPAMVYTCAYYADATQDLAPAQTAKLEHVCRKVGLEPGMRVVEAGCGWGALALHMARYHGVKVRAFNISHEQIDYARRRAQELGLDNAVEFVEDDYRNIAGRYDAFVSVGMLEHVGPDNFRTLGGIIRRCLSPRGRGLVHSVGRNLPGPMNGWIHQRVFPGSYTPSLREMMEVFESAGMSVLDVENLRLHYARTLADWLRNFDQHLPEVTRAYDEYFVRAWRLYLGGCSAAFAAGILQLFQVVFTPAQNNHLPRTRASLYGNAMPEFWEA